MHENSTDSQTLKNVRFPNETVWRMGGCTGGLGGKFGSQIKFGCDDCYTNINVIKFE